MRIVMLNWRYVDHPGAGGAETLTHGILQRLAAVGHEITCFTAAHPGAPVRGVIDGIQVVRGGRQWTVHFQAWRWLRGRLDDYDLVIDQINTIPFLTPLYVPEDKRRFFIHQLAREYWWRETRGLFRLLSPVGYVLEPRALRLYRDTRGVTVSDSTMADLASLGISTENMSVVPEATDVEPVRELTAKPDGLRLIVLGRLTPAKFVEEAIRAFVLVAREIDDARLDIVGGGDARYRRRLRRLVRRAGLEDRVTFHGRVSHEDKVVLLEGAHIHLFASHREGWGLTVTEAAALGTPSLGYDVPGVRDAIRDSTLLASVGDYANLARLTTLLARAPARYEELRRSGWEFARSLSYDRSARAFAAAVGCHSSRDMLR